MKPATKEAWNEATKDLPRLPQESLDHELVMVEPLAPTYFTDDSVQHCILKRPDGTKYITPY